MVANKAPFYAIYNVGVYTFAPFKVIWAEQKEFCAAVVSVDQVPLIGDRPYVPDHKLFFVDFYTEDPAFYLCGLLNSEIVIEWVKSHNISIQIGDIFKHMTLPKYDPQNRLHKMLVKLAKKCHSVADCNERQIILDEASEIAEEIILKTSSASF
jgi:hypothetical protein